MLKPATIDAEARAQAALAASPIYVLRELRVRRDGDVLAIRGRVDSFYHKQLAQELIRTVADGYEVVNEIDVAYDPDASTLLPRPR